jgi:hypothetical protein
MPGPALNCAMFFTSIVAWTTDHAAARDSHTNVWCMRRAVAVTEHPTAAWAVQQFRNMRSSVAVVVLVLRW